jgi:phospholipid transport system substrate-binding protein
MRAAVPERAMRDGTPAHCSLAHRRTDPAPPSWGMRAPLLAAVALLVASHAHAQLLVPPPSRADAVMQRATTEVTTLLQADAAARRPTDLTRLVEKTIVPMFDLPRMTSLALGRNWRLASPEQQAVLTAEFQTLFVHTYASVLSSYRDETVEYKPLRAPPDATEVLVRSVVRRAGAEPLSVDYEMAQHAAGWKVYDVKVEGVSLVINYRESFNATVREGGIDALIRALAQKNRENEAGAVKAGAL